MKWMVVLSVILFSGCDQLVPASGCSGEWQVRVELVPMLGLQRQAYAEGWEPIGATAQGIVSRRCVALGATEPAFQQAVAEALRQ